MKLVDAMKLVAEGKDLYVCETRDWNWGYDKHRATKSRYTLDGTDRYSKVSYRRAGSSPYYVDPKGPYVRARRVDDNQIEYITSVAIRGEFEEIKAQRAEELAAEERARDRAEELERWRIERVDALRVLLEQAGVDPGYWYRRQSTSRRGEIIEIRTSRLISILAGLGLDVSSLPKKPEVGK